ncbi:unnamed protein product [Clonostachys rhizophaga]|uniref:Tryptophan dimethylallyltransferase n=1 Tax=Clonostachys rhizophaga TaxID=160324 RepID=A0A9N9YJH9_9HYPO|nr:unnamed protein product [Clonostachys rhizophaga]
MTALTNQPVNRLETWQCTEPSHESLASFSEHQWYRTAGYLLASLLQNAGYSQQAQLKILGEFAEIIAPHLGLPPGLGTRHWQSFMTDDHNPIELSWDFHTGTQQPTIRYSIEPIGLDAGSAADPNNTKAPLLFKRSILKGFPHVNTELFKHFENTLGSLWEDGLPEGHRSTIFWAFDLKEGQNTAKAYFFPGAVARATNRSNFEVIHDAISSAPTWKFSDLKPLHTFINFMQQHKELALEVEMLALDLVNPAQARLKIYFRCRRTEFSTVRKIMSLGGAIENLDGGLEKLKALWDSLLGTQGHHDDMPLPHNNHRTAGILFNVEFKVQSTTPKVKLYIPARHYAKSDQQVIEAVAGFLNGEAEKLGHSDLTRKYTASYASCLHKVFNTYDLSSSLGIHTYIGCSVQSDGNLRVVTYFNPQQHKFRSNVYA